MGSPVSQIQAPQTSQPMGKSGQVQNKMAQIPEQSPELMSTQVMPPQGQSDGISRPMGKGGRITYPGQTGQPRMGQPNQYSNTVGPWDNATIGVGSPFQTSGKGGKTGSSNYQAPVSQTAVENPVAPTQSNNSGWTGY